MKTLRPGLPLRLPRNPLSALVCAAALLLSSCSAGTAAAQSANAGERFLLPEGSINDGTTVVGPLHRGLFGSVTDSLMHDSQSGWADAAFLTAAYHLNADFSVDVTAPYYAHFNTVPSYGGPMISHQNEFGDIIFAGRFHTTNLHGFDYTLTGATTAHNGDTSLALGAGRMTGLIANHLEHSFAGPVALDAVLAYGNSSEMMRQSTRKDYLSVGKLGFLQAGGSVMMPRAMSLDAHFYDQVPLASQVVVSTVLRKNTDSLVLFDESSAEDYGFNARLGVPFSQRLGFAVTYNDSVPLDDTVVGVNLVVLIDKPINRNR